MTEHREQSLLGAAEAEAKAQKMQVVLQNIALKLKGQDESIELAVLCLLSGGHLLIQDLPGVGKTSLALALAQSLDLPNRRVQFTADMLPSDILGLNIFSPQSQSFSFHPGPIFTQLFLADEINRAEPRTQSALLEAMFERQVSIDGEAYPLEQPFMVIATQNPVDFSGTFPLPDSQLDRFLLCLSMGYPAPEAELEILRQASHAKQALTPVMTRAELLDAIQSVDRVYASEALYAQILSYVHTSRSHGQILQGASTRAMLDLLRVSKARALLKGRAFVLPEDVDALVLPCLAHRIRLANNSLQDPKKVLKSALALS